MRIGRLVFTHGIVVYDMHQVSWWESAWKLVHFHLKPMLGDHLTLVITYSLPTSFDFLITQIVALQKKFLMHNTLFLWICFPKTKNDLITSA